MTTARWTGHETFYQTLRRLLSNLWSSFRHQSGQSLLSLLVNDWPPAEAQRSAAWCAATLAECAVTPWCARRWRGAGRSGRRAGKAPDGSLCSWWSFSAGPGSAHWSPEEGVKKGWRSSCLDSRLELPFNSGGDCPRTKPVIKLQPAVIFWRHKSVKLNWSVKFFRKCSLIVSVCLLIVLILRLTGLEKT